MSTLVVKRPARRPGPRLPSGELILDPPPELPTQGGRAWLTVMTTLPMIAGSAAMALLFSFQRPGPLGYLTGGAFGVSMLGLFVAQIFTQGGQSKREMIVARRTYMRHLSRQRRKVRATIVAQRRAMFHRHPDPESLWSTARSHRLWERRGSDADFGLVRVGLGPLECGTRLVPPDTKPVEDLEPMCAAAVRRFVKAYSVVPGLPVALALRGFGRVHVRGEADQAKALTRALVAQVVTLHAPEDVLVAVCCSAGTLPVWDWAKWLPHAQHPTKTDALGSLRLVTPTTTALEAMLDDTLAARPRFNPDLPALEGTHVVVVLDDGDVAGSDHLMTDGGIEGVTIVDLTTPPRRMLDRSTLVLEIDADGDLYSTTIDGREKVGRPDALSVVAAETLARTIAPMRLSAAARAETSLAAAVSLSELLQLGDPHEFQPGRAWGQRPNRDRLRIPIGVGPDGEPVDLDLKESAQDGMGPHGLLIGATGAGKSELLRTLVLALAATHSSEVLNFVLIDFKGGATFTKLDQLPHTSAVITNLSDEIALVDRMHDAISGELVRRQELLRDAGNHSSQRDYERARASGAPLAALPSLIVICDEFSELLTAKPDFIDMFVQIGRVGRSLGIHLLLASQRLDEGRLRGLDTHLSFRLALRTLSAMESRAVLGVTDAYELPRAPGHGYLGAGNEPLVRFRAAYVSGAYRGRRTTDARGGAEPEVPLLPFGVHYVAPALPAPGPGPAPVEPDDPTAETELDVLVDRMRGRGVPARQVWLPPLSEPPTLDELLPPVGLDPDRGLGVTEPDLRGGLVAPIGVVDRPFEQRRDLMWLDLSAGGGHTAIVGAPRSGKTTLLRTLVAGLALTHTPAEAQFYCLDLGGGALASLRGLPHVGAVAVRHDDTMVRRTVAEVVGILREREQRFAASGVESIAAYRRLRRDGGATDDPYGDVFLAIDGLLSLRVDFEDLERHVLDIANRGLSFGIHVVITAARWADVRPAMRDLMGSRVELRLGDPADSMISRRAALNVPESAPGRGLTPDGLHFLAALPRLDSEPDPATLPGAATALADAVRDAWPGKPAPSVRLLPARYDHRQLPKPAPDDDRLPIGIAESDLGPVFLDFAAEPHLLVFGDVEAGKSNLLRMIAAGIVQRNNRARSRIMLIDHRRSLLGVVPPEHLLAYGTSPPTTAAMVKDVALAIRDRLPGPDVTAEQLRDRSWWAGPDIYVLIDDYDLVAGGPTNPIAPLIELVAQGRDIGLHIIVTRRVGGASRALYDPFIARLRESATPGLIMSGSRDEGVLLGNVKPQPLPPGRGWLVGRRTAPQLIQLAWMGDG